MNFAYNGLKQNDAGWWEVKNGNVKFDYYGLMENNGTWWAVQNGHVNFGFNGLMRNPAGLWVVSNGKVNFGYNGTYSYGGITYNVQNGLAYIANSYNLAMEQEAQQYSSPTKNLILVDRRAHRVEIFQGSKGNWAPIKYWPCVVGAPRTPTITGMYNIGIKGLYFNTGTNGRCWYYSQIRGNYLFHSIIYDRSSTPSRVISGTMDAAAPQSAE